MNEIIEIFTDLQHNAYPEYCTFTERYDHRLTATGLADVWDRYFKATV